MLYFKVCLRKKESSMWNFTVNFQTFYSRNLKSLILCLWFRLFVRKNLKKFFRFCIYKVEAEIAKVIIVFLIRVGSLASDGAFLSSRCNGSKIPIPKTNLFFFVITLKNDGYLKKVCWSRKLATNGPDFYSCYKGLNSK
jgi:hypothetical protein